MTAKAVRNLLLTLIVLLIGVNIIFMIGKGFTAAEGTPDPVRNLLVGVDSLVNIVNLGLGAIIIILLLVWLSKRSEEKKAQPQ